MTGFVTKKIGRRRTLGSILKAARTKMSVSLEQAETETKIRLKYLQALESGLYQDLPAEAYNIGFVRCYSKFLGLNQERILHLYREERSDRRLGSSPDSANFSPRKMGDWQFLITPKVIGALAAIVLFGGVTGYIGSQLKKFTQPPDLNISSVPAEFTTTKDTVELSGAASQGSTLLMNSEPILVSSNGQFSQNVQLSPGLNEIIVLARSRAGKESRRIVKVLYRQDLAKVTDLSNKE